VEITVAKDKRAHFRTSVDELPTNRKPNVQKVVQSGLVPKPWQELLDLIADKPVKTQQEMVAGRMALLRGRLEEEQKAYATMVDWKTFDAEVQGFVGSADAAMLFRLEDFTKLNDGLVQTMAVWGIRNVRAAAVRLTEGGVEIIRVKAIVPPKQRGGEGASVVFDEPGGDAPFPSEELMTKLQMINPGD